MRLRRGAQACTGVLCAGPRPERRRGVPAATGGRRLRRGGDRDAASKTAEGLLNALGLKKGQGRELQNVPLDRLMAEGNKVSVGPVVDGKVLPAHPFDPVATPLSADVPVIVGYARTERTVYDIDDPSYGKLDEAGLLERTKRLLGEPAAQVIADYRRQSPKASPYELATNITTDASAMSSIRLAERRAALHKAPTYLYVFAWETPVMGLRAPHTIEIPFVFNHIDSSASMVGSVTPPMRRSTSCDDLQLSVARGDRSHVRGSQDHSERCSKIRSRSSPAPVAASAGRSRRPLSGRARRW